MIDYFYTNDFDIPGAAFESTDMGLSKLFAGPNSDESEEEALRFLLELYIVADKYEVLDLVDRVCRELQHKLADKLYSNTMDTTLELIDFMYLRAPPASPVRSIIFDFILSSDLHELFSQPNSKDALTKHDDFLFDLMKFFAAELKGEETKCCKQPTGKAIVVQGCLSRGWCHESGDCSQLLSSNRPHRIVRSFFPGVTMQSASAGSQLQARWERRGSIDDHFD